MPRSVCQNFSKTFHEYMAYLNKNILPLDITIKTILSETPKLRNGPQNLACDNMRCTKQKIFYLKNVVLETLFFLGRCLRPQLWDSPPVHSKLYENSKGSLYYYNVLNVCAWASMLCCYKFKSKGQHKTPQDQQT